MFEEIVRVTTTNPGVSVQILPVQQAVLFKLILWRGKVCDYINFNMFKIFEGPEVYAVC